MGVPIDLPPSHNSLDEALHAGNNKIKQQDLQSARAIYTSKDHTKNTMITTRVIRYIVSQPRLQYQ